MARFRLRFLLQELDLVGPEVVLGRSPECQITIDDPLVSRQHARISLRDGKAFVVDLGSRNGVRINGKLTKGEAELAHNDRVRLGTQDLVFLVVDEGGERLARSTGYMMHCAGCGRPFPGESMVCPHCGTTNDGNTPNGYDTITGFVMEPQTSWTFQLLGEVIDRALSAGRALDAERMFQRAAQDASERVRAKAPVDPKQLSALGVYAMRLSTLMGDARWANWALDLHLQLVQLPSSDVLDHIEALPVALRGALVSRLALLLRACAELVGDDEVLRKARLGRLLQVP